MSESRESLEEKLIRWYRHETIQGRNWAPRLFWLPDDRGGPFGTLRVDACELEVIFATILGEASECRESLDLEQNGRGTFLAANARRHELPLLTRKS
ncbi:hypothetical protein [Thioalkalivibrio sulfidiphilus]|uniref:hypothetical protein n=1 Tax=Thioalkalivibrio sulfidiphilus TaxID=1033854 RepID=UPI000370A69F|nr:hypothetical protein [Thioalkalivibrio sulfidiphilus]